MIPTPTRLRLRPDANFTRERRRIAGWLGAAALLCLPAAGPALAAEAVVYTVVDGVGVTEPLTEARANPDRGGVIYLDPARGRCGDCHRTSSLPDRIDEAAGAGPDLDGVATRLSPAELRLIVINPRIRRPDAAMPAYFNVSVEEALKNPDRPQPVLSAREVEDVVAFLLTLTAD